MFAKIIAIRDTVYIIDIDKGYWSWTDEMFENMNNTKEIILPEGWEIDKIESGKIVLKESRKELPKTWEECCVLLDRGEYISNCSDVYTTSLDKTITHDDKNILPIGLGKPMLALCQLLICREVYRQGWKPNFSNVKYCISYCNNEWKVSSLFKRTLLSFETYEIAEEFLKNFKDLLEQVKILY